MYVMTASTFMWVTCTYGPLYNMTNIEHSSCVFFSIVHGVKSLFMDVLCGGYNEGCEY